MPRKKTNLHYISNAAARRITLRKRRLGLLKKLHELSVLCDVPACAIIYSPHETEPQIWPSPAEAIDLLRRFTAAEGFNKANNMMNQEKFMLKQIAKLRGQLGRIMAENDGLAGELLLLQCLGGRMVVDLESCELELIGNALARRIEAVEARLLMHENNGALMLPAPEMEETVAGGGDCWTDEVLAWEAELISGCENVFQPNL